MAALGDVHRFERAICNALGLDPLQVQRISINLSAGNVPKATIDLVMYGPNGLERLEKVFELSEWKELDGSQCAMCNTPILSTPASRDVPHTCGKEG